MVKDNCWTNYDLTVDVTNASTGKVILSIVVPQGQSWSRKAFVCQPSERLSMKATFSPVFWASDKGKSYLATHDWVLPDGIKTGDTAWNVNVCYSDDFTSVPITPDSNGACKCSLDKIPIIPPQ